MSAASKRGDKVDQEVYDAAKAGDLKLVQELVKSGGSVQMAVMGAGDGKQGEVGQWAMENGACMLWAFKQETKRSKFSVSKFGKNISMLNGPGEVPRGTFNKTSEN